MSNDRGSFLPASLSNEAGCAPVAMKSSLKSSQEGDDNNTGDDDNGKKKTRKKVQRSVSFNEAGPLVQQIDSMKSILEDEFKENQDDPELKASLNGMWYDHHEVETMKQDNAQLIYDKEDELSVASSKNGGEAEEPDLAELERRLGDSFRGLERQTEEGSWAHFQNRANVLGAVLDTQTDDADELASLASEATQEARSVAQQRALEDEKEAKEYLSDVRDMVNQESLNAGMDRLNATNTLSFNTPDGDDASVLTNDDDSITSDFSEFDEDLLGDDEEDEPLSDGKFANIKIDFEKPPSRTSLKERIDKLNATPKPPPFQAAKTYDEKLAEKSLPGSIKSTSTAKRRVSARRSLPNRNKSLDLACPIATMNKPENSIVNKEERWLSNQKITPGAAAKRFSRRSINALSLTNNENDNDNKNDDVDDDGESLFSGLNKSDTSLGLSLDGNSNHSSKMRPVMVTTTTSKKKKKEKRLSSSSLSLTSDLEDDDDEEEDEVELMDASATTTPSKKKEKRLSGTSLASTIDGDEDNNKKDEVELTDASTLNKTSDHSIGLSSTKKKSKKESSKKIAGTSSTKTKKAEPLVAPPELKTSTSLGGSKKLKDATTMLKMNSSNTSLSLANMDNDESDVDFDMDAKAAIKAIKKNRKKKIQRVKTMPTGGSASGGLDLSCPNMTLNKPASPTKKKKTTKSVKDGNASASSAEDDQKPTLKKKKRVSRSRTLPTGATSLDDSDPAKTSSGRDQDDSKKSKSKKRLSRIASMNEEISNASQSTEEPSFKWESSAEERRASTSDLGDLEPGSEKPPTLKARASTGTLGQKKAKKRASLPTLDADSDEDDGKSPKEANEEKGLMGGMLGLLIADAKQDSDMDDVSEKSDKKERRHTVSGAFGALMSMDKDNSQQSEEEEEEKPKQRASTGTSSTKKKTIRSSKSSVGTTTSSPKKTRELPRRSKSESKKLLLPSNSSRTTPPRSSSIGSKKEKVKLPSNGKRSSIARIPRRKTVASEATDAS